MLEVLRRPLEFALRSGIRVMDRIVERVALARPERGGVSARALN
jgi:hypothetical protein